MPAVCLSTAAFDDLDSLTISLRLPTVSDSVAPALIDLGLSHCFINSTFVSHLCVPTKNISPIRLCLLDGLEEHWITQKVEIPIVFSTGEQFFVEILVTLLDPNCPLIIRHQWLCQHNPLIDWTQGIISFRTSEHSMMPTPKGSSLLVNAKAATSTITPPTLVPPDTLQTTPSISMINAVAFAQACRLPGSHSFTLSLNSIFRHSSHLPEDSPDLSEIPKEYRDYADVFSKSKADTLAQHQSYDLKIELEDGAQPPPRCIYSLSPSELKSLCEFLDEHLSLGFI